MVLKIVDGKKLDIKPTEIRYRVLQPSSVGVVGRREISPGVSIIAGCPKGHVRKGRCNAGTKTQALRFKRSRFSPTKAAKWIKEHWNDE